MHLVEPVVQLVADVGVPKFVAKDAGEDLAFVAGAPLVPWDQSD